MVDTLTPSEVRLRLLEQLIPVASSANLNEPEKLIEKCTQLENYVLQSQATGGKSTPPPPQRNNRKPRKG